MTLFDYVLFNENVGLIIGIKSENSLFPFKISILDYLLKIFFNENEVCLFNLNKVVKKIKSCLIKSNAVLLKAMHKLHLNVCFVNRLIKFNHRIIVDFKSVKNKNEILNWINRKQQQCCQAAPLQGLRKGLTFFSCLFSWSLVLQVPLVLVVNIVLLLCLAP